jgi:hypothetical protein
VAGGSSSPDSTQGKSFGAELGGLAGDLFADRSFNSHLVSQGYLPFALGAEGDEWSYDPVCFDLNAINDYGECRILRFEHESILSFDYVGEVWTLWPSLEAWMTDTINAAAI